MENLNQFITESLKYIENIAKFEVDEDLDVEIDIKLFKKLKSTKVIKNENSLVNRKR